MTGKAFVYDNVRISEDRRTVGFDYQVITDEKSFQLTETLTLPEALVEHDAVNRVLRALHLALGLSYYKTFIPPVINHAYTMDGQEADFWNDVLQNGLGEFLLINKLATADLARFEAKDGSVIPGDAPLTDPREGALLGIGGGKDSIVAGEVLKELGIQPTGFVMATGENRGQAQAVADVMQVNMLAVERRLDPQILTMNELPGALNGHIPISLIFALVGCLLAINTGKRYVIVANEASSSIPQANHNGSAVNHQWSKSLDFEKAFQSFVHKNIDTHIDYFSLIRPLTSVAVAKMFADYPQYLETFTSDNSLFKIKQEAREHPRWSKDSPKSLSSFILLAPWLQDEKLIRAFGQNFLNRQDLTLLFDGLLGQTDTPILDCVGTPDELRLSLSLLAKQNRFTDSILMKHASANDLLLPTPEDVLTGSLTLAEHALPETLEKDVTSILSHKLGVSL